MTTFLDYNLSNDLMKSLKNLKFHKPTEIQEKTIPIALNHNDVLASAETGSGKTAAYLIPLIQKITLAPNTYGLILVPTRELALQTSAICKEIGKHLADLQIMVTTGGTNLKEDIMRLYSPVHIVDSLVHIPPHLLTGFHLSC